MANLMDLLQSQLTDDVIGQLSQQLGGVEPAKTKAATSGILTTLMGALAKNASNTQGATALNNALEQDHDGSLLEDLMGAIQGRPEVAQRHSRALNGTGILKHVLGERQSGAVDMISKMSGLDQSKTGNLMSILAPIVMGTLGQQKKQGGLDIAGIIAMLSGSMAKTQAQNSDNPLMGMIGKFLDSDGDGSIIDDIGSIVGKGLLKNLFGGR